MITSAFTRRPARSVRNRFVEEHLKTGPEPLSWPLQGVAADDVYGKARSRGEADLIPLLAGQGLRMLDGVKGAAEEIIRELVEGAGAALSRLRAG